MAFNNNYGNSFQRTTPVVLNLIIINVLVYFAQKAFGGSAPLNSATNAQIFLVLHLHLGA